MITVMETWNHPEAKEGEVFIGNGHRDFFNKDVGWKTKRLGMTAYNPRTGEILKDEDYYPMFAQESELKEHGVRIVMREMGVQI